MNTRNKRAQKMRAAYNVKVNNPKTFDNKHEGQRAFIIGGGPSVSTILETGFNFSEELKDEITFGINKAYHLLTPTYLVFGDAYFWKHFEKEVKQVQCMKIVPDNIVRNYRDDSFLFLRRSPSPKDVLPTTLAGKISFINNSGVAALRIAYMMGCNPIYLVGIDVKLLEDGRSHYHNYYEGLRAAPPTRYKQFYTEFQRTLEALKGKRQVISCSDISALNDLIPYIPIQEVLRS
jgi:hypothetical protein